jgi:hypothetical protein
MTIDSVEVTALARNPPPVPEIIAHLTLPDWSKRRAFTESGGMLTDLIAANLNLSPRRAQNSSKPPTSRNVFNASNPR